MIGNIFFYKAFTALTVGNVEDAKNFKFGLDVSAAASGSIRLQRATFILDMKSIVDAANLGGQLTADHGVIGLADEGQAYLMNKYGK